MAEAGRAPVTVVGGGLAGCEAAVQLAARGHRVRLVEMRPVQTTPAHRTDRLGELVCTNSFKAEDPSNAHGQLKREMRALGSVLLQAAKRSQVAAGAALAVDRELFADAMTEAVAAHDRIEIVREEVRTLPTGPAVIATGPLTSDALAESIRETTGDEALAFFDAIAPIVDRESIDDSVVFAQGRWDQDADYLNCPMTREEYEAFVAALRDADVHEGGHDWDRVPYFEGCLPIEVMAERGLDTLRFGPMKPVGLTDPRSGERPWAVVQLRREDRAGQMWNIVGFQTRLRIGEQKRVFRQVPGLEAAEFLRMGSIHRNSYLNSPGHLSAHGSLPDRPDLLFAGQLTGVEGYTESAASGILAGINLARILAGAEPVLPPPTTMLGGLCRYLSESDSAHFQPMNSNWGLVDPLQGKVPSKRRRRTLQSERAQADFLAWMTAVGLPVADDAGSTGAGGSPQGPGTTPSDPDTSVADPAASPSDADTSSAVRGFTTEAG